MSATAGKRKKKTTINPKIHVTGTTSFPDEDDKEGQDVSEVRAETDEDSAGEDPRPRGPSKQRYMYADEDDSDFEEDEQSDDPGDEGEDKKESKPYKSKEEKKQQKKELKMANKAKAEEKNCRTIFVGNLPSTCQPRELRKHFIKCGSIESVRLRGIIPSNPKIPKKAAAIKKSIHETCKSIFGYVVFWDPDSVSKALELNTTKIGDNYISIQRVGNKIFDNDVTVFIGNLPLNVQENAVRQFFDECGNIQGVRLIRDSVTGVGKGFGFVSFSKKDGVVLAIEKNGAEFEGREIRVKKAGRDVEKRDKQAQKVDSKNARRRLRNEKEGKKSKGSVSGDDESDEHEAEEEAGIEEPDDEERPAVKKKKQRTSGSFSGEKVSKSANRKKKQKLLKGRQTAGKKRKIARLLTA